MNKTKQFWALFKFQVIVNPTIWVLPIVFAVPLFVNVSDKNSSLDLLLGTTNLFFIFVFGIMLLSPQSIQRNTNITGLSSTEFLLTRAVDRSLVNRSRATIYYFLVLVFPAGMWLHSLSHPDIQVFSYGEEIQHSILTHLPGSTLESDANNNPNSILIPNGNSLVQEWRFLIYLLGALGVQVVTMAVYPFKYRTFILWTLYGVMVMAMICAPFLSILTDAQNQLSWEENSFFSFVAHQSLYFLIAIPAFVLGQLWCERRFTSLEQ